MSNQLSLKSIDVFGIEELFENTDFDGMRDHLATHYGDPIDLVRERIKIHSHHKSMNNGIHRFLFEDAVAVEQDKSRSKVRKECGKRAYGVIQRSNAFSRLIAECFPNALRLSIHPQPTHALS
jgi:pyoverdine/dityrosine biosynthesis protein Dit1